MAKQHRKSIMRNQLRIIGALCKVFALACVASVGTASGGPAGYLCVIKTEGHLTESGELQPYPRPLSLGKKFAVDRRTGAVVDPDSSVWIPSDARISVHASGNAENSFTASYLSEARGNGVHLTTISVEEFASGPSKPFVVASGGTVLGGTCE